MFLLDSTTRRHHQSSAKKSVQPQFPFHLKSDGRRGFTLSDTRLEFRPFGAVKHRRRDFPLQDYLAARPLRPRLHLSTYLAAHSTAAPVSHRFSLSRATRAATCRLAFSDCTPPLGSRPQQAVAVKVCVPTHRYQQDFSFTPSEPNLLFIYEPVRIRGSHEQVIDLASTRGVH